MTGGELWAWGELSEYEWQIPAVPLMVAHAQMGGRGTLGTGEPSEYDTGNSSLVVRSIVYIFFRAISRTTSTFWVISQENVFESSLAEPENGIYHRWCTFHETNPADEKNNTVIGKHSLVYSNIARAKPKLKIQIVGGWLRLGSEWLTDCQSQWHLIRGHCQPLHWLTVEHTDTV